MTYRSFLPLLVAAAGTLSLSAHAATPTFRGADDGRLVRPNGPAPRAAPNAHWSSAPLVRRGAFAKLQAETGKAFATWDPQTDVPQRILLSGVVAPGVMNDPKAAETFARDFLARHLDLLAPGSQMADLRLVANDLSAGIRSVGFAQHHNGLAVLGGQVSLRFKHDRLVMIGSEAFANVVVATRSRTATPAETRASAVAWLASDVPGQIETPGAVEGPFILPLVDDTGRTEFREVFRTSSRVKAPSTAWDVYVDAATGAVVARRQTLMFGAGVLLLNVPARNPAGPRIDVPANQAFAVAGGASVTTTADGIVEFPGASTTIEASVSGVGARVENESGPTASASLTLNDGGVATWADETEEVDAQLSAYVHALDVKDHVRTIADIPWLADQLPIAVNINDSCNAFSDGNSINFFESSGNCENTALLADVVYHEFGHSIHTQSVIPGVGQFDVALSEGVSDYLACSLTGDSGLGRGFFYDNSPLRDFDPQGSEFRWPEDRGEVHDEGRIIGGALWDLRKAMVAKLGEEAGAAYTDRVWYETTRRAVDIPSMYPEALLLDDDDGDLTNGTPNACEINAAYGPHGLFNLGPGSEKLSVTDTPDGKQVELALELPSFADCPISASPELRWRIRGQGDATTEAMQAGGAGYLATIPPLPSGTVVEYQVLANYSNGAARTLPDNQADPWYQAFFGQVTVVQCLGSDWPFEATDGWVVGPYQEDVGATNPTEAFGTGDHIYQAGDYAPLSNYEITFAPISTQGRSDLRLQMRRWLAVEDGIFDVASIDINGTRIWKNAASVDKFATLNHIDREWRFVDFDLSEFASDGELAISFAQTSDPGLEFGGWALSEACIVALEPASCGDGLLDAATEECDDGNNIPGDGCSPECTAESGDTGTGGDSFGQETESGTDDGDGDPTDTSDDGESDTDNPADGDGLNERGCGCSSPSGGAGGAPLLSLVLLAAIRRRRAGRLLRR